MKLTIFILFTSLLISVNAKVTSSRISKHILNDNDFSEDMKKLSKLEKTPSGPEMNDEDNQYISLDLRGHQEETASSSIVPLIKEGNSPKEKLRLYTVRVFGCNNIKNKISTVAYNKYFTKFRCGDLQDDYTILSYSFRKLKNPIYFKRIEILYYNQYLPQ